MKTILLLCSVAALARCAPQEFGDAEFIPAGTGESGGADGEVDFDPNERPIFFFFDRPRPTRPNPFHIFSSLFPPFFAEPSNDTQTDDSPVFFDSPRPSRPSLFDLFDLSSFFKGIFGPPGNDTQTDFDFFPAVSPGELPPNYENSTTEVKNIDGQQVEVNRTVTKTTDENGITFTRVQVVHTVVRENDTAVAAGEEAEEGATAPEDPDVNEVL